MSQATPKTQVNKLKLYTPHSKQRELHECTKRFAIASFGRQSGKSTYAINQVLIAAWERPSTKYWYVSPTYPQSRVMYRRLVGMLWGCRDVMIKKNQTELRVKLINNSEIRFVSGQVYDNLRGETLDGAIIDEVREQHHDLWPMVIRPMLTTTKGWCRFVSTPSGYDHFYDLAQKAKDDPDWTVFTAPSTANPLFTKDEYEASRKTLSEPQFRQEIMAEFVNLRSGKVYYAFGEHNKRVTCPFVPDRLWSPYHPVVLGLDFNVNPMSWTLGQFVYDQWWWFDEIRLSNTPEACDALVTKLLMMKEQGHSPTDYQVILCGDASGNARSTKGNESDYEIIKQKLKSAQIKFRNITPAANPSIKDRVNAVNAKCRSADGGVRFYVHSANCRWLIHDLERVVWKTGADFVLDPGKDKMLTHSSDSAGYPVAALSPVKVTSGMSKMKVIPRSL